MASPKGGSGKTVLTASFSSLLASIGKRVLAVDTDAATNGLTLLYLKETLAQRDVALTHGRLPCGVYELATTASEPELIELSEGMFFLPATYTFTNTEDVPIAEYEKALSVAMTSLRASFDYIFLDAQAGSDHYAHVAMSRAMSDLVVIVSEYDPLSAAGIERLKGLFPEDLNYVRTWILLNKMLPEFVQSFSDFLEVARYLSPIPWDADVVRAYARRRLAIDTERGNDYTLAVTRALRSLFGDEIAADLDTWTADRAAALREPIEVQVSDLEKELEGILLRRHQLDNAAERRRLLLTNLAFTVPLTAAIGFVVTTDMNVSSFLRILLPGALAAFLGLAITISRSVPAVSVRRELEHSRLRREEEIIEERLRTLQALVKSRPEELIRAQRRAER